MFKTKVTKKILQLNFTNFLEFYKKKYIGNLTINCCLWLVSKLKKVWQFVRKIVFYHKSEFDKKIIQFFSSFTFF